MRMIPDRVDLLRFSRVGRRSRGRASGGTWPTRGRTSARVPPRPRLPCSKGSGTATRPPSSPWSTPTAPGCCAPRCCTCAAGRWPRRSCRRRGSPPCAAWTASRAAPRCARGCSPSWSTRPGGRPPGRAAPPPSPSCPTLARSWPALTRSWTASSPRPTRDAGGRALAHLADLVELAEGGWLDHARRAGAARPTPGAVAANLGYMTARVVGRMAADASGDPAAGGPALHAERARQRRWLADRLGV